MCICVCFFFEFCEWLGVIFFNLFFLQRKIFFFVSGQLNILVYFSFLKKTNFFLFIFFYIFCFFHSLGNLIFKNIIDLFFTLLPIFLKMKTFKSVNFLLLFSFSKWNGLIGLKWCFEAKPAFFSWAFNENSQNEDKYLFWFLFFPSKSYVIYSFFNNTIQNTKWMQVPSSILFLFVLLFLFWVFVLCESLIMIGILFLFITKRVLICHIFTCWFFFFFVLFYFRKIR